MRFHQRIKVMQPTELMYNSQRGLKKSESAQLQPYSNTRLESAKMRSQKDAASGTKSLLAKHHLDISNLAPMSSADLKSLIDRYKSKIAESSQAESVINEVDDPAEVSGV